MKIKDQLKNLRSKSKAELVQSVRDLHDTIAKSKVESALGDATKVKSLRPKRKELARIYTILSANADIPSSTRIETKPQNEKKIKEKKDK